MKEDHSSKTLLHSNWHYIEYVGIGEEHQFLKKYS